MTEANGRIKLTWPQIAWGISVLLLVVGAWYDLRTKQIELAAKMDTYYHINGEAHLHFGNRLDRIERATNR